MTSKTKAVEWKDGNNYPVIDVEISSASHPFYTGTARVLDTAGRVERFERRYGRYGARYMTFEVQPMAVVLVGGLHAEPGAPPG